MGLFPSSEEFAEALGVTPEDHARWEKNRAANRERRNNTTAKEMMDRTVSEGVGLAKMAVQSKMNSVAQGQQDRENARARRTVTTSRTYFADEPEQLSDDDPIFGGF